MKTFLLAILLVLVSCGATVTPHPSYHFFFVIKNNDTLPVHVRCMPWFESTYTACYEWDIPPGTEFGFDLGKYHPDGVEISTVAWTTSWGKPDYGDCYCYIVAYPNMSIDKRYLKK